jgi:hypothetical protein
MQTEIQISKVISSVVLLNSTIENSWDKVTNVEIEEFKFPWYFRLLNIPKPIKAEILHEGVGGKRKAYFDNKKTFTQEIVTWEKYKTYSFIFSSEDKFKAGYFFNIFQGAFRIFKGTYFVRYVDNKVKVELLTHYSIDKHFDWLLHKPVFYILTAFQKYLLNTIKTNSEK